MMTSNQYKSAMTAASCGFLLSALAVAAPSAVAAVAQTAAAPPAAKSQPSAAKKAEAPSSMPAAGAAASTTEAAPRAETAAPPLKPDANLKLKALEERVNGLKEKIFRSKARLILLQEAVLHGTITGARAVLLHKNEMGGSFKLEQVQYALDGAPIFNKTDADGGLDKRGEFEIFNGSIVPGNHQVSVYLVYRGNGFGIFSYLADYKFKLRSSFTFSAEEGKQTTIRIVGYEKGTIATDLRDRPSVRYDVEVQKELRSGVKEGETKGPASAPSGGQPTAK